MPPKRVKSGGAVGGKGWESALTSAKFDEDSWRTTLCMVVAARAEDESCVNALKQAVQRPLRKLFTLLSRENILEKISELGNPKTRKTKDPPVFYEVTEFAKSVLDVGEELSVDLMAKLVKFQLLTIKSADQQRRATLQKAMEEKAKFKAGSTSVAKDKSGPIKGSAKGEKDKKGPEPASIKETKLKRRGEEDDINKYIDDEPDDGPQHYVLMTGFHQPQLISALYSLGVHVSTVIKLSSDREDRILPPQDQAETLITHNQPENPDLSLGQELDVFWTQLDRVLNSSESKLQDVAKLDYKVEQSVLSSGLDSIDLEVGGLAVFEGVACLLYDSLDWRKQHQHYLNSLKLIHVPQVNKAKQPEASAETAQVLQTAKKKPMAGESSVETEPSVVSVDVDTRLYSDLLDGIPAEVISVPLILHCILEQVLASEQEGPADLADSDLIDQELTDYMLSSVLTLPQSDLQKKKLIEDFSGQKAGQIKNEQKHPAVLNYNDQRRRKLHNITVSDRLDVVSVEAAMMERSSGWKQLMITQQSSSSLSMAQRHELLHYCSDDSLPVSEVQRLLQLCVFESMPLTAFNQSGDLTHPQSDLLVALPWDDPVTFVQQHYKTQDFAKSKTEQKNQEDENKVTLADLEKMLTQRLRDWNFTERHHPNIFPQVLQTASECYRCVDTFSSRQDSTVFIICHNPSPQRSSRECWEVFLHTDVRFRDYLEHVSELVRDWIREEEQKLQEQTQREICTITPTCTIKETPVITPLAEQTEPYIRQESLKAWKLEQERLREEEFSKKMKKEKGGKTSAKGERDSARESRKTTSPNKRTIEETKTSENITEPTDTREFTPKQTPRESVTPVFTGYSMDGKLLQVKGETHCIYPSDGGQISVEKSHFIQGSTQLNVCVKKHNHLFYTHVYCTEEQRQNNFTANTHDEMKRCGCFYAVLNSGIRLSYSQSTLKPDPNAQEESECALGFPLKLYAALPTGLQVSFQFEDGTVCVRQQFCFAGHRPTPLEYTHTEFSRIITWNGSVIKHMRDGSTEVLFADGTVSSSPDSGPVCVLVPNSSVQGYEPVKEMPTENKEHKDKKGKQSSKLVVDETVDPVIKKEHKEGLEVTGGSWTTTTPSGFRVSSVRGKKVEVKPIQTFHATDPFSQSVVITREDHVLSVVEQDGTAVVDHADGTRITTIYQQREPQHRSACVGGSNEVSREKLVKVERCRFSTVMVNCENKSCDVFFGDGTVISANTQGEYTIHLCDGGVLQVSEDGVAVYNSESPKTGPKGDQSGQYVMSHFAGVLCKHTDSNGNLYQVTADGQISVNSTETSEQDTCTQMELQHNTGFDTHKPRLFVLSPDGSALEFLCAEDVEEILNEAYTNPSVAVIKEPLPHMHEVFGITILRPFTGDHSHWLSPKEEDDIIPTNLKNRAWDTFPTSERKTAGPPFGITLGRGLDLMEKERTGSFSAAPVLNCPDTLLIRQITQNPLVTEQLWRKLQEKLLVYIKQLLQREKLKNEIQLKELRTAEEKLHHADPLQLLLSLPDSEHQLVTMETQPLSADVASLYYQAMDESQCPVSDQAKNETVDQMKKNKQESLWGSKINQHRMELQKERRHLHALRNHLITPYFHPELLEMSHFIHQQLDLASLDLPPFPKK